jgi:hypothetical protein
MDCASFEHRLAELMGGGHEDTERQRRVDELRAHAQECVACAGSGDLLELLALPAGERDIVASPDEAYWAAFNDRVRARIAERRRLRSPAVLWSATAAAAMILVAVGTWLVLGPGERIRAVDRAQGPTPASSEAAEASLPEFLVSSLTDATPSEVQAELESLEAWGETWRVPEGGEAPGGGSARWGEGLFPEVEDLDADSRRELLDWLRSQTS